MVLFLDCFQICYIIIISFQVYHVSFDNAIVSAEFLGDIGDGFKVHFIFDKTKFIESLQIASELQNSARFAIAASLLGIAKEALHEMSSKIDLSSSYISNKIVNWASKLLGIESGLYFTTNVTDNHPESTFGLENAVLKVSQQRYLFFTLQSIFN